MGVVIPLFPQRDPNCFICVHHEIRVHEEMGSGGGEYSFCGLSSEVIDDETYWAQDCPDFTDDPTKH